MEISAKKTKAMIVNYTDNHQFHTRMKLKGQNVDIVDRSGHGQQQPAVSEIPR